MTMQELGKSEKANDFTDFSPEALQGLKSINFPVYSLVPRSIGSYTDSRGERVLNFRSFSKADCPAGFEELQSMGGQASFDPIGLFVPHSFGENYKNQQELLVDYNDWLSTKVPDVKAIVGGYPDWFQITVEHFRKTGKRLFSEVNGNLVLTRTKQESTYGNFVFGDFRVNEGPRFTSFPSNEGLFFIGMAPLIVPA